MILERNFKRLIEFNQAKKEEKGTPGRGNSINKDIWMLNSKTV